jgi:replication factor C large subunit
MSSEVWVKKYAPKRVEEIVGNKDAKESFLSWISSWSPTKRPKWALLVGPPGVGKTSLVYAYARENGFELIELNNENLGREITLDKLAELVSTSSSLFARKKIVLVESVEVLHLRDSEMAKLFETLEKSRVPVVFTANDQDAIYSSRRLYPLRQQERCAHIAFSRIRKDQIRARLKQICDAEEISVSSNVLDLIAESAQGDLRAAINDLQAFCSGEVSVRESDVQNVYTRDTSVNAYKAVLDILLSPSIATAKNVLTSASVDEETILAWLIENIPDYEKPLENIYRASLVLSRASTFGYLATRLNRYELKKYMLDLMCYSPQPLGEKRYKKLNFPARFKYSARSWEVRMRLIALARVLGAYLHTSRKDALRQAPFFALMSQNPKFGEWFAKIFGDEALESLTLLKKS